MHQIIDLTGKKYNNLTVIRYVRQAKDRNSLWLCKCDCGKEKIIKGIKLKSGSTKSCGCFKQKNLKSIKGRKNRRWKGHEEISGTIWRRIRVCAEQRDILFDITIEQVWDLFIQQNRKCSLTGLDLIFSQTQKEDHKGKTTASLDRIDSKKGYTIDNVQWVHKDINYMKMCLSQERFIELAIMIANKYSK